MVKEAFVEPWRENIAVRACRCAGRRHSARLLRRFRVTRSRVCAPVCRAQEFVEVAKPLAQRANAAAAAVIRSPTAAAVAALPAPPASEEAPAAEAAPPEPRSHAPAPAPLIVDLPACYFPAPPGEEAEPPRRAPAVARPAVPGAEPPPPPPPRNYFQGSGRAAAPAPPIMMTPLEIQRLANARAAAARQAQAQQHFAQHAARPPLPSGAYVVGAPASPPAHAVAEAKRAREAANTAARAVADAAAPAAASGDAPPLSKRLDDMFSVIETLPRGVSAEAEDWAAIAVAERAAALRGAGGSSGSLNGAFSAGAAEAIAAAAAAREAASRGDGGAGLRAAAAEAERARQRLAALRASHPDSFPLNPKALYTPWRDDAQPAGQTGGGLALAVDDDDDYDRNPETHLVARALGPRWRVRLAAAMAVFTAAIYLRGERAGWGVEGTAGGLLTWHAGDAAAADAAPSNRTHAQLSLVVRAAEAGGEGALPLPPPGAAGGEALQAQAAAALDAAAAAEQAAAIALAKETQTHAPDAARRLLRQRTRTHTPAEA